MKKILIKATPLYNFLRYCNESPLEKVVLDLGAAAEVPPLSLFYEFGYKTYGLDMSPERIAMADEFAREHGMELNIKTGNMKAIPFDDETMSFVYSFKSVYHLGKEEMLQALGEVRRVLKPGGLCFINFLSTDDPQANDPTIKTTHSFYDDAETDGFFDGFEIKYKSKRIVEKFKKKKTIKQAYIDYIAGKI
ncbi:MAG: class I SAM-dependent methyltransferase [bacterium]|nr:class I SAM-dependent methyltransferase [bacterium]